MAEPGFDKLAIISQQPTAVFPTWNIPSHVQGPPILAPLVPLTYMALKHDRDAECCSATAQYQLVGRNKELLLKGYSEPSECCQQGSPPIIIQSLGGTSLIQVQIEPPACCSTALDMEICAPPGNPIGSICLEKNFFSANTCELKSKLTGQSLGVETKFHFLSGPEYFFTTQTGLPVAVVKCERSKYRLEIAEQGVDSTMKANLIGFMIMIDVIAQAQKKHQQQQIA